MKRKPAKRKPAQKKPPRGAKRAQKTASRTVAKRAARAHPAKKKTVAKVPRPRRGTPKTTARGEKKKARALRPVRPARSKGPGTSSLEVEVSRLRAARARLERRLTAAVQEIGLLRHYEQRARLLENELQKRDREIVELHRATEERIREIEARAAGRSPEPSAPPPPSIVST